MRGCLATACRIFFDYRMSEILSVLGGAVLGSLVAAILYGRQAERQLRVETVRRFVANRFDLTGPDFSQAMNEIVVVFASKRKAIAALDAFRFDKTNANLIDLYRELSAAAGIPSKAVSDDLFLTPFNVNTASQRNR